MSKNNIIIIVIAVIVIIAIAFIAKKAESKPGVYDEFAQCLSDENVTFYGAFWCHNCESQKAMFKKSEEHLPYTECSTPNGQGQTQVCIDEGIERYPTWEFADGERIEGVISLEVLAEKTGCPLLGEETESEEVEEGETKENEEEVEVSTEE